MATDDELSRLRPFSWRGIVVPLAKFTTRLSNSVAQHPKPNQDGVPQEPTGNDADVFDAEVVFLNKGTRLMPPRYADPLFPFVLDAFVAAMRDTSVGTLVHPRRGDVRCVPLTCVDTITAQVRDGEHVTASWREHTEDGRQFGATTALTVAIAAGADVDAQLDALRVKALRATLPDQSFSFEDAVRSIRAVTDSASLFRQQVGASLSRTQANLGLVRDAVAGTKDPSFNPSRVAVERMAAALDEYQKQLLASGRVGVFVVVADTTLAAVARVVRTTVTDLVQLNPDLVRDPVVRSQTAVRYTRAA